MNRVMIPLLTSSMMTPLERAAGRFMRAPDHTGADGGGATPPAESSATGDNTGGNSADSGNDNSGQDNSGQPDPLKGFWEGKPEGDGAAESADDASAQESQALGTELRGQIEAFAPPAVFTKEIAEQVAEGNFDGINQAIAVAHRTAIQQSIGVTAKLLGAVVGKIQAGVDARVRAALGNQESESFLQQNFPQAKDPAYAPMVKRVWDQALVNTKGNREEAIRQTRGMLQAMGKEFAPDDIREPASDPHAGINTAASKSLVQSLLER